MFIVEGDGVDFFKKYRHVILFIFDSMIVGFSYCFSIFFMTGITRSFVGFRSFFEMLACVLVIHMLCFVTFKVYVVIWRYARYRQMIMCVIANLMAAIIAYIVTCVSGLILKYPLWFFVLQFLIITLFMLMSRMLYVSAVNIYKSKIKPFNSKEKERLMVIGAGELAVLFFDDLNKGNIANNYEPVCIVDDDISKRGRILRNVKIVGGTKDIVKIAEKEKIDTILFCIKNIDDVDKKRILNICSETKCRVSKMTMGVDNNLDRYSIQKISIDDLLGRKAITLKNNQLQEFIGNKVVMITGGGGSIGSELCRHVAQLSPKKLVIVDNYENNAYSIQQELIRKYEGKLDLHTEIASVCDENKMRKIFSLYKPEIVYHAAAHKHVPFMEHNPEEAVKNNILGTNTIVKLADEFNVKKFVMVSTDKAVNPTNVMGATKRCCEMIVQSMDKVSKTEFVAVRFGNVLGSNGSVIPLFEEQIRSGGPVTVTHPDIIRYFMTIPEAVQLLLAAGSMAKGGEIFILDMGEPVKIVDLAIQLIKLSGFTPNKDIKVKFTGLRPGEKLFEELLLSEEGIKKTTHDKIFIGNPIEFNEEKFFSQVEELKKLSFENKSDEVRDLIIEMVPTYRKPAVSDLDVQ